MNEERPNVIWTLRLVAFMVALSLAVTAHLGSSKSFGGWYAAFGVSLFLTVALLYTAELYFRRLHERYTEVRTRQQALERQVARQKQVVDSLADGLDVAIFLCTSRGEIEYANHKAVELFRFDEPVGRSILAVTLSHDLERLVWQASKTGEARSAEVVFRYPEERVGLARAWKETPDNERVFLSIYEITHLRQLERVRKDFVANVSHELRTPLTTIRAMAETLMEDEDGELHDKYLNKIISEVDRLTLISDDLLTLGIAESSAVSKSPIDLSAVISSTVHQLEEKAAKKGLKLEFVSEGEVSIEANPQQMTQVAMNLIDNAIHYSNQGVITVSVRPVESGVEFAVADSGIGIASDQLSRVFERFYRVDKGRSRASGGTGLGLSIVKHIVETHGGKITVESELNKGSTFRVFLPND